MAAAAVTMAQQSGPAGDLLAAYDPENGPFYDETLNALFPGEQHITVVWGRDFSDVSPLKGVILGGGAHRVQVGVDVEPLDHPPASSP